MFWIYEPIMNYAGLCGGIGVGLGVGLSSGVVGIIITSIFSESELTLNSNSTRY
jgi:hypothetical protein